MYHWNTQNLIKKLSHLGRKINVSPPGGDHDTEHLIVEFNPEHEDYQAFYIAGWDPNKCFTQADWSEADVVMLTLSDGQYQDTPLSTADPDMIQLYADILKVLKAETKNTGCGITHHWKEFF